MNIDVYIALQKMKSCIDIIKEKFRANRALSTRVLFSCLY